MFVQGAPMAQNCTGVDYWTVLVCENEQSSVQLFSIWGGTMCWGADMANSVADLDCLWHDREYPLRDRAVTKKHDPSRRHICLVCRLRTWQCSGSVYSVSGCGILGSISEQRGIGYVKYTGGFCTLLSTFPCGSSSWLRWCSSARLSNRSQIRFCVRKTS